MRTQNLCETCKSEVRVIDKKSLYGECQKCGRCVYIIHCNNCGNTSDECCCEDTNIDRIAWRTYAAAILNDSNYLAGCRTSTESEFTANRIGIEFTPESKWIRKCAAECADAMLLLEKARFEVNK